MKICAKCKEQKLIDMFGVDSKRKDKLNPYCKACKSKMYFDNKYHIVIQKKEYRKLNDHKIKAEKKAYYNKNKERLLIKQLKYAKENNEKIKHYKKNYYQENKPKIYAYVKNRMDTDSLYSFRSKISHSILSSFKRKGFKKASKTEAILGCTIKQFTKHILSLCPKGVSENDFGRYGYHLDHIIPISAANTEDEITILCHYTNYQPLWWRDNIIKSNKLS